VFRAGRLVHAYPDDIDKWLKSLRFKTNEIPKESGTTRALETADDLSALLSKLAGETTDERFAVIRFGKNADEFERVEVELKSTREKYRTLIETIPEWVWETNKNGEYIYSSPRVVDIVGYTPDEVIGHRPVEFLISPSDTNNFNKMFGRLSEEKRLIDQFLCRFIHRDGSDLYVETSARPVFGVDGAFVGYSGISRDVTERVKAEEALETSRNFLDQILNGIFEEVIVIDREYNVIKVNSCFEIAHKMTSETILGRKCYQIKYGLSEPCRNLNRRCPIYEVFDEVAPVKMVREKDIYVADVTKVDIFAFPIFNRNREIESVVQISRVTKNKNLTK